VVTDGQKREGVHRKRESTKMSSEHVCDGEPKGTERTKRGREFPQSLSFVVSTSKPAVSRRFEGLRGTSQ
jgi:hypothetical protein